MEDAPRCCPYHLRHKGIAGAGKQENSICPGCISCSDDRAKIAGVLDLIDHNDEGSLLKGDLPGFDELFAQMTRRAAGMDPGKIKSEDVARSGGAAEE
jgi:hypothetical protein